MACLNISTTNTDVLPVVIRILLRFSSSLNSLDISEIYSFLSSTFNENASGWIQTIRIDSYGLIYVKLPTFVSNDNGNIFVTN